MERIPVVSHLNGPGFLHGFYFSAFLRFFVSRLYSLWGSSMKGPVLVADLCTKAINLTVYIRAVVCLCHALADHTDRCMV